MPIIIVTLANLQISVLSLVKSLFSCLTLCPWVLSPFIFLVSVSAIHFSIYFWRITSPLTILLSFVSVSCICALGFMLDFLLLSLDLIHSFFTSPLIYRNKWFIWGLSFCANDVWCKNCYRLISSDCFCCIPQVWCVLLPLAFISTNFLVSSLISAVIL